MKPHDILHSLGQTPIADFPCGSVRNVQEINPDLKTEILEAIEWLLLTTQTTTGETRQRALVRLSFSLSFRIDDRGTIEAIRRIALERQDSDWPSKLAKFDFVQLFALAFTIRCRCQDTSQTALAFPETKKVILV